MSFLDREPPWHVALYAYGIMLLWTPVIGLIGGWANQQRAIISIMGGCALLVAGYHVRRRAHAPPDKEQTPK